ncbi:MAG: GNAT family N-acetyltransferase [Clostridia bacterium]|nr:GNAT family N-acetyltransferase [Clostridia bacterium]
MKNIELYVPQKEDFWFRAKCMADADTMSYNAGYDVNYYGYHYDTGCIDFPEEKWLAFEERLKNPNFYYAYILDYDTKNYVGYVNYNLDSNTKKATIGIVIKSEFRGYGYMKPALKLLIDKAKNGGVKFLTDTVPKSREVALKVFYELGFVKTAEIMSTKFNKPELFFEIQKEL